MLRKMMERAIEQARKAAEKGEVPVGAVLVKDNTVIARAHNETRSRKDPTAHAEMLVIQRGSQALGTERLKDCELYVTLEPCPMCAGAILHARLKKIVYGADEPVYGSLGSWCNLLNHPHFRGIEVYGGIMEAECKALMQQFFQERR